MTFFVGPLQSLTKQVHGLWSSFLILEVIDRGRRFSRNTRFKSVIIGVFFLDRLFSFFYIHLIPSEFLSALVELENPRVRNQFRLILSTCVIFLLAGCATYERHGLDLAQAHDIEKHFGLQSYSLSATAENKILALDPLHVTAKDIREVLSNAPAPHIINIHGGSSPARSP